jgi:uncharacterized BrkB/YihY/UPF0761 family membrane protein
VVALLPFALLAIVDIRIPAVVLIWVVVCFAACLGPGAYFKLRFRNVSEAELPRRTDIPRRLLVVRALLPTASTVIGVACLVAISPRGPIPARSFAVAAAVAAVAWSLANWAWRRWARALGFAPDAVLASVYRSDSNRRQEAQPPAA